MNARHAKATLLNFNQRNTPKFWHIYNSATPKIFGVTYELSSYMACVHNESSTLRFKIGSDL